MVINPNKFPLNDPNWIEEISAVGVFESKITQWISHYKNGEYQKADILGVARKVAKYRNTPFLLKEIRQRVG